MNDQPETLHEINLDLHGFTADNIIEGRQARNDFIRDGAIRGNTICLASESLHRMACFMGIDVTYDENLDDLDLE